MPKKKRRTSRIKTQRISSTSSHATIFFIIVMLLAVGFFLNSARLLAKGGDSGGSDSGKSGGGSSDSKSSDRGDSGSGKGSSDSSKDASVSDTTKVMCTGPDGKQFETRFKDCEELNKAWNKPTNFTVLSNQPQIPKPSGSTGSSGSRAKEREEEKKKENEEKNENINENEHNTASGSGDVENQNRITKVQVEENKTRIEQIIVENGFKKKVEMRNDNGRIRIRVKTENPLTGAETDQRLELRPEEGLIRLKVEQNGVEQSVKISVRNNRFVIEQEGFGTTGEGSASATTQFPLTVDPTTNSIAVTTPLGTVNVQRLPAQAIQQVLANKTMSTVTSTELGASQNTTTDPNKQVVYRIAGVRNMKFLGLIKVDAPILTEVSAITGRQTFVQQPWFLNAFGFLFV